MASARILRREARTAKRALTDAERITRTTLADVKKSVTAFVKANPCDRPALKAKVDAVLLAAEPGIGPAYLTAIQTAVDTAANVPCKIRRAK